MHRVLLPLLLLPLGLIAAGCTACLDAFDRYTDVAEEANNLSKSGQGGLAPSLPTPPPPPGSLSSPQVTVPARAGGLLYRPDRRLEARLARNEIPQLEERWDLFATLKDGAVDPATGGVLVCDLRMPGTPWYKSRPDMEATLTLGSHPAMVLVGEDNRDATVVTAPIPKLAAGDPIKLLLEDRDFIGRNDYLDSARADYAGVFPLLLVGDGRDLHATCRGMRPPEVQRRLALRKRQADEALATFDRARALDPTAPDWGYPWPHHDDAEAAIERVPALVGWGDPDVRPMLDRLAATQAAWEQDASAAVKNVQASALPLGSRAPAPGGRVDLTVHGVVCDAGVTSLYARYGVTTALSEPECVVELQVSAPASAAELPPLGIDSRAQIPGAGGVDMVLSNGRTEPLVVQAVVVGGAGQSPPPARVEVGMDLRLLLGLSTATGDSQPLAQAVMLRIERGKTPLFLLLR